MQFRNNAHQEIGISSYTLNRGKFSIHNFFLTDCSQTELFHEKDIEKDFDESKGAEKNKKKRILLVQ